MKHNSGQIEASDIGFMVLITFIIGFFVLAIFLDSQRSRAKTQIMESFYNSNSYIQVKNQGVDMWIKKSDIEHINKIEK